MQSQPLPVWIYNNNAFLARKPGLARKGILYFGGLEPFQNFEKCITLAQDDGTVLWTYHSNDLMQISSSLIELDGTLYFASTSDHAAPLNELHALNAQTGTARWRRPLAAAGYSIAAHTDVAIVGCNNGRIYGFSSLDGAPRWSIAVDGSLRTASVFGDSVIVGSQDGRVLALSVHDGTTRWTTTSELPGARAGRSLVHEETYYFTILWRIIDPADEHLHALSVPWNSTVLAIRIDTGATIWSWYAPDHAAPDHIAADDSNLYVALYGQLVAIARANGEQLWETSAATIPTTLAADSGRVLLTSADLPAVRCFDSHDGHELFRAEHDGVEAVWCWLDSDAFYVGAQGQVVKYGAIRRWLTAIPSTIFSTPIIASNVMIFGAQNGKVYALAADTGNEVWTYTCDAPVDATPVADEGMVYIGCVDGRFRALRLATGAEVWQAQLPNAINSSPVIWGDLVIFGCRDNKLHALDKGTGIPRWEFSTNGFIDGGVAVSGEHLVVGSGDGALYALDALGYQRWKFQTEGEIRSRPLVNSEHNLIVVGNSDNRVYGISLNDGTLTWELALEGAVTYNSPVPHSNDYFWIATEGGRIYHLKIDGAIDWISPRLDRLMSSPVWLNRTLYIGGDTGKCYALGIETGEILWTFNAAAGVFASPVTDGQSVYICGVSGDVFSIFA